MHGFTRNILSILLIFLSSTAFAQVLDGLPVAETPAVGTERAASVVYKFSDISTAPEAVANLGEGESRSLLSRIVRVDRRVFSSSLSDTLLTNDTLTLSMDTPNRTMNNALSFVGTVSESPLSATTTKLMQILSLVAARKANFALTYAAKINQYSRLESVIDCRFYNTGVSKVDVLARIQYRVDF
jgi:hypothetical protein